MSVIAGDALARGLRNTFAHTYKQTFDGMSAELGKWISLGVPSDKIQELFGYFESAPHPSRRGYGDPVKEKGFRARNYTVDNVSWDLSITWQQHQRLFDQLRDLEAQAHMGGQNFARLPERVFFQYLAESTNVDLLASLPNAPDGAAIFSTTDGASADRFGVSGGNLLTGSGITTAVKIRDDYHDAIAQFLQFQDTEGQPMVDPSDIQGAGVTVIYAPEHLQIFKESFIQARTVDGSNTPSNVLLDAGDKITLVASPYISGDDWFVLQNAPQVPLLVQTDAMSLTETVQTVDNSDIARTTKKEGVFWQAIQGYGLNLPLGAIKVNN